MIETVIDEDLLRYKKLTSSDEDADSSNGLYWIIYSVKAS